MSLLRESTHQGHDRAIIERLFARYELVPEYLWQQNAPSGPIADTDEHHADTHEAVPVICQPNSASNVYPRCERGMRHTSSMVEEACLQRHWQEARTVQL